MLRSRAFRFGISSLLLTGLFVQFSPGCGAESGGLGPEDGGSDGGDGGICAYASSFSAPADKAKLGRTDDISGKGCSGGLVINVKVATGAPDGSNATLYADAKQVATAKVAGAQAVFSNVTLPSKATSLALKAQIGDDPSCIASEGISIDCGLPACVISTPKGPYLNGRLVADGGDRVDALTDPFATKVVVTTDIEDGQSVSLSVNGGAALKATAKTGSATFDKVTMSPDGSYTVTGSCTNAAGNTGSSGPTNYTVITGPVDLKTTSPTTGQGFGVADGGKFKACATTTTAAAIDPPADARLGQKNYCVSIGTGTATCDIMKSGAGGGSACVTMTCPTGSAPFSVNFVLSDKAGNQAKATVTGVHCESTLASVQIVAPKKYDSADPTTILNRARGDAGTTDGSLLKTVVACTDKPASKGRLNVGMAGGTLSPVGTPVDVVAATAADGCPAGLGYVVRFPGVHLPESIEKTDGSGLLVTATEIRVDVTDSVGGVGSSPNVDLWVDATPPQISFLAPGCGKVYPGTTDVTDSASFLTDTLPFTFKVTGAAATGSYPGTTFDTPPPTLPGKVTLSSVKFYVGSSALSLVATDAAGNPVTPLSSCSTYVGNPPVVGITTPTDGQVFNVSTGATTGVSGTVTGATSATTVSLKVGTTASGSAPISAGAYSFAGVALPDSDALPIAVSLVDTTYGTISKSVTVLVDTHAPTMSGSLTATVDAKLRRAAGVDLSWTAASDFDPATGGTRACDHYEIRRATTAITDETAYSAATVVAASVPGSLTTSTQTGGQIPVSYYFAVRCIDKGGNRSPFVTNTTAVKPDYIEDLVTSTDSEYGRSASAYYDIDKNGVPDLVVGGQAGNVRFYFGSKTAPIYSSTPTLTLTGAVGSFGYTVQMLKDFNGDGSPDVAIGDPGATGGGNVYVVSGAALATKTGTLAITDASLTSSTLTIKSGGSFTIIGANLGSAGSFDGSALTALAINDFAATSGFFIVTGRSLTGTLSVPSGAGFVVTDSTAGTQIGFSFAAQDLNADGFTDIVAGDNVAKAAYVFRGRALGTAVSISEAGADSSVTGTTGFYGYSLSIPGAISSTGYDMIVGAPATTATRASVDVDKGSALSFSTSTTIAGASCPGTCDRLGSVSLTVPPGTSFDADKDGHADILTCGRSGGCLLWYGTTLPGSFALSNAARKFDIQPSASNVGSAASLGDADADGYDDVVICSPGIGTCRIVH